MPFAAGNEPTENRPSSSPIARVPKQDTEPHKHPLTLAEFHDDYEADGRHPHFSAT